MKPKRNIYTHKITLTKLYIKNKPQDRFRSLLEQVNYLGYEVEEVSDGRKIVITKPGGKFTLGTIKREDFMVWIHNPKDSSLWLISHKNILDDLKIKGEHDPKETIKIIDALEKVFGGSGPDDIIGVEQLANPIGEPPEVLLKAYKWIWGQEDCNYPSGKGRLMSWEGWKKQDDKWAKTGDGIVDLRGRLKKET